MKARNHYAIPAALRTSCTAKTWEDMTTDVGDGRVSQDVLNRMGDIYNRGDLELMQLVKIELEAAAHVARDIIAAMNEPAQFTPTIKKDDAPPKKDISAKLTKFIQTGDRTVIAQDGQFKDKAEALPWKFVHFVRVIKVNGRDIDCQRLSNNGVTSFVTKPEVRISADVGAERTAHVLLLDNMNQVLAAHKVSAMDAQLLSSKLTQMIMGVK